MKEIKLSKDLSLPIDTVTQSIGILAKKRSGKSYCARKLAEGIFNTGQQLCIVDPKGDWWGIRFNKEGKGAGLPIIILGGERGDLPLEVNGGSLVAKLLVEERVSILLDLSLLRKYEVATFMTAFMEDLYRLKAQEKYRTPLMLLIDEADAIAPQKPQPNEARMLGAAEDIVRRGGQRGIGCTMITQRSAVLNKNVLTQIQLLICLRTISPQDLGALDEWIQVHGERDQRKTLMESLPSLPIGDAWLWSPGWPDEKGIFQRTHIGEITTYDSGATPKAGQKRSDPRGMAHVDLDSLRNQMAETMEKAKASDPKELKKRIAELERELKSKPEVKAEVKTKEVPVISDKQVASLEKLLDRSFNEFHEHGVALNAVANTITTGLRDLRNAIQVIAEFHKKSQSEFKPAVAQIFNEQKLRKVQEKVTTEFIQDQLSISKCERAILQVLATRKGKNTTRPQLGILSGYSSTSGSFSNSLSSLRTKNLITGSDPLSITEDGLAVAGDYEEMPTGKDLQSYWYSKLGKAEQTILKVLIDAGGEFLNKEVIGDRSGYSSASGSFSNSLSKLRTLQLIEGSKIIKAADVFFA